MNQEIQALFSPSQLALLAVVRDVLLADPQAFEGRKETGDALEAGSNNV